MIHRILSCIKFELAHKAIIYRLSILHHLPLLRRLIRFCHKAPKNSGLSVFGISFPTPVCLAAGFDVDGKVVGPLSDYGFGAIEIGSLSPKPQYRPISRQERIRCRRRAKSITRSAFTNNCGVSAAIRNLNSKGNDHGKCRIGANLAADQMQNKDDLIISGFEDSFSLIYDFADYIVINFSNPNEDGIRNLQNGISVEEIMEPLLAIRLCEDEYKPVLVKLGNDIEVDLLDEIIDYCRLSGVDGIVIGNSARTNPEKSRKGIRFVSGSPIFARTLELTKHIKEYTDGRFPIVACGGIMNPSQAQELLEAGASLIQINSALHFCGLKIVRKFNKSLK